MPGKFFITTFGCRTNQADSAAIRQEFCEVNFRETEVCSEADVIVVNSCTVTHRSDQQVRQLVRKLRRENPSAQILVTGCYAQREPEAIARIKGVDAVVGNTHKGQLVEIQMERATASPVGREELAAIYRQDFSRRRTIDVLPAQQTGGRTRPFVKIQDGCDAKCSYCIIPQVRGPSRSADPGEVLRQVRTLVQSGFKEIVLTGIHIGTYGLHLAPRFSLDRLLQDLLEVDGLEQLRISSIEPMELSRRVIAVVASSQGRIAPHFHICLQSGADSVLRRMLRPYNSAKFARIVEEIRELLPGAGIGTDVIVGFPGETRDEHLASLGFVERMPFTYLHVFPYSDRSGTRASGMDGKVAPSTIRNRAREFRELSSHKNREFQKQQLGNRLRLITLDETEGGFRRAVTGNYLEALVSLVYSPNRILELEVEGVRDGVLMMNSQPSNTTIATA